MDDDDYDYDEIDYTSNDYKIDEPSLNEFIVDDISKQNTDNISEGIVYLKESQLLEDRDKLIIDALPATNRSYDETALALMHYKWSYEHFCEEWYTDVDRNLIKCGIVISPDIKKKLIDVPCNGDECLICCESKNATFASLSCGHQFCGECWEGYLNEKTKDFNTLLTTTCPQTGCNCIVYESILKKYIKVPQLQDKLNKAIIRNFTSANMYIRVCPNPKCGICVKTIHNSSTDIKCLCGYTFCFKCCYEGHRPCECDMVYVWDQKNQSDSEDYKWISAHTKKCPHCGNQIEKSTGCNYMLCKCGKAFCYVCGIDWNKHSQDHYKCNKYTEAVKQGEREANEIKQKLERFKFYYDRYINYTKAIKICNEKLRRDLEEKISFLLTLKQIPLIETQFLETALNAVIRSKSVLKNTYIFGYYMKDDNAKTFFEFSQGLLERNADELNFYLEKGDLNTIIESDTYTVWNQMLTSFRSRVMNLAEVTLKYMDNLCKEIENKYHEHINYDLYESDLKQYKK